MSDHTGIAERAEVGFVYTEGVNGGDACVMERYLLDDRQILGYGAPAY